MSLKNRKETYNFQIISSLDLQILSLPELLIVQWNDKFSLNEFILCVQKHKSIKKIIFRIGQSGLSQLHLLLNNERWLKLNIPFILTLNGEKNINESNSFLLSTIFGGLSLSKVTPNFLLRAYYKYLSYSIFVHSNSNTQAQNDLIKDELKYIDFDDFSNEESKLNHCLNSLSKEGKFSHDFIDNLFIQNSFLHSTLKSILNVFRRQISKKKYSLDWVVNLSDADLYPKGSNKVNPRSWSKVLLTGWYGTETAGDKAILGEIIYRLKYYNPTVQIYLSSIDFRVSWQTRIEMNLDVKHIPISSMGKFLLDEKMDAIIMGGGPLMESSQIVPIAKSFQIAAKQGIQRVVFGCGVGPIHTPEMEKMISHIIKLSTVAFYRDKESLTYALSLGADIEKSVLACDPALAFVRRWKLNLQTPNESSKTSLSLMLRMQTSEYYKIKDLETLNINLVTSLSKLLKEESTKSFINFITMHQYWRGNDDRFINNLIKESFLDSSSQTDNLMYMTIDDILNAIQSSKTTVAMRYHGHIFSIALNVPFISIDYTGKNGKVSNLLERISCVENSVEFKKVSERSLKDQLNNINLNSEELVKKLKGKSDELENNLFRAYEYFWN